MNSLKRVFTRNIMLKVLILLLLTGTLINGAKPADAEAAGTQDVYTGIKIHKIVAGNLESFALDAEGNLWAWGEFNTHYSEGIAVPQIVTFFKDKAVKDVQSGNLYMQVLLEDGTVWIKSDYSEDLISFYQVKGLKQIRQISEGATFTYATQNDGTVWRYLPSDLSVAPVIRPELANSGFKAFVDSYALKDDGTVWNIGNDSPEPVQVPGLTGIKKIIDGQALLPNYALSEDGQVWGWGNTSIYRMSQTGSMKVLQGKGEVQQIQGLESILDIASGEGFFTALKKDKTVWAWGFNERNQLGDGTAKNSVQPVKVSNLNNAVALSHGSMADHTFAILEDRSTVSWGDNSKRQSGTGSEQSKIAAPQKVDFPMIVDDAEKRFTFTSDGAKGNELGEAASNGQGMVIILKPKSLLVSKDAGVTWSTKPLPVDSNRLSIIYQHDRYFLSDQNWKSPHLYYSMDGDTWTETATELEPVALVACTVAWQNNQFILLSYPDQTGKTEIYTSADGKTWSLKGKVGEQLDQIFWNGKRYMMTYGGYTYYGSVSSRNQFVYMPGDKRNVELIVYTSDDLSKWTQQSGAVHSNLKYRASVNGRPIRNYTLTFEELKRDGTLVFYDTEGNNLTTKDGINFQMVRGTSAFSGLSSRSGVFWNGKQYLIYASLFREEGIVFVSTDKVNWKQQTISNIPFEMRVTYTGKSYVGVAGTRLAVSKDGLKWQMKQAARPDATFYQTVKGNGIYVSVGALYTYSVPVIATSKDGKNWQQVLLGNQKDTTINGLTSVAWNGSMFVAVGRQYAWTSKNGTAWTRNNKPLDAKMDKIVWTGKQYVAIGYPKGNSNKSVIYSSTNGTAWKKVFDWSGKLTDISAHSGTVVATGTTGSKTVTLQSTNLLKWNLQTLPVESDTETFVNVQWAKDKFIIVSDHIYTSVNGLQWTAVKGQYDQFLQPHNASNSIRRIVWTGQDYRFLSNDKVGVSKDLKSWSFYKHDEFFDFNEMLWTGSDMLVTGDSGLLMHLRDK